MRAPVSPEDVALGVDDVAVAHEARRVLAGVLLEEGGVVAAGHEAHLLGIRLVGNRQPEPLRVTARRGLRHGPDREQRARELALPERVQHVRLVLVGVGAAEQMPGAVVVAPGPHVVPRGHEVDPEPVGPAQERPELDVLVAAGARVRRPAGRVLGVEVGEDRLLERPAQVDDLHLEPADPADPPCVRPCGGAAAAVVDAVGSVDELDVRAEDLVALLLEQARGDRRVDPAGHGDEHRSLRGHATESTAARGPTSRRRGGRSPSRPRRLVVGRTPCRGPDALSW
jgi:hypothetical protein